MRYKYIVRFDISMNYFSSMQISYCMPYCIYHSLYSFELGELSSQTAIHLTFCGVLLRHIFDQLHSQLLAKTFSLHKLHDEIQRVFTNSSTIATHYVGVATTLVNLVLTNHII